MERNRFEVRFLNEDELALCELPAIDQLVGAHLALMGRAVALLFYRRATFAMQHSKAYVLTLLRDSKPDGDGDETERE